MTMVVRRRAVASAAAQVCMNPLMSHVVRSARRFGSAAGPSRFSDSKALWKDLHETLAHPEAAARLNALVSPASKRNLISALAIVDRQQQIAARKAMSEGAATSVAAATVTLPELKAVALVHGLPFIGFGFVDNAIMILAGDYIDLTLGVSLGISSMAAAGIGNTISDIAGLGLGNVVEDLCARLGLPSPILSPQQLMLKQTRLAKVTGSVIGVTIGCLLGMVPLLFLHTRDDEPVAAASTAGEESVAASIASTESQAVDVLPEMAG